MLKPQPSVTLFVVAAVMTVAIHQVPRAQTAARFALESAAGLRLHNVTAEPATLQERKGLRIRMAGAPENTDEKLAVVEGSDFGNGVIEAEIAGAPQAGAPEGARGFVGLAFRVQSDLRTYDAFYLRPTNGRAEDQVRRNHSAQYISHPSWTWSRFRTETPEKYESYVDLVPATWTKIKIEVRGTQARLFVHDQPQPTLVVNDVKTGSNARGAIALWLDVGTEAHFRNLTVTPWSK